MGAAIILWNKHMRKLIIHKEGFIGMLLQPILWVIVFGIGMRSLIGQMMPGDSNSYIAFIVPGIIALSALGGATAGGSILLEERLRGIIKEYLVAPMHRLNILIGNALSTVTKSLLQAIIILIVGVLMGARIDLNPLGWIGGIVLIAIYGLGFGGIGLAVASSTKSTGAYHSLIFLLNLPLLFLSNALYSLTSLPKWMGIIARINPTSYVVDGLRQMVFSNSFIFRENELLPLWLCFIVVIIFGIFGISLAYIRFRKSIK